MISVQQAEARLAVEHGPGLNYVRLVLEPYERAQTRLSYLYPKNPRTYDGEGAVSKAPQVLLTLLRFVEAGVHYHHDRVGDTVYYSVFES